MGMRLPRDRMCSLLLQNDALSVRSQIKYPELAESGASETQWHDYLAEGEPNAVTLRVPKNLKDAAAETSRLRGVSFSAFVRSCIINELAGRS